MRGRTILMRLLSPSPPLPPSLSSLLIFLPLFPFLSFFPFLPACVFSPSSLSSPAVFLFPTSVPLSLTAGSVGPGTSVCWLFMAKAKHRTYLIDCHSLCFLHSPAVNQICCFPTQCSALVLLLSSLEAKPQCSPCFFSQLHPGLLSSAISVLVPIYQLVQSRFPITVSLAAPLSRS